MHSYSNSYINRAGLACLILANRRIACSVARRMCGVRSCAMGCDGHPAQGAAAARVAYARRAARPCELLVAVVWAGVRKLGGLRVQKVQDGKCLPCPRALDGALYPA